jgi:hypothetical protein
MDTKEADSFHVIAKVSFEYVSAFISVGEGTVIGRQTSDFAD